MLLPQTFPSFQIMAASPIPDAHSSILASQESYRDNDWLRKNTNVQGEVFPFERQQPFASSGQTTGFRHVQI